MDFINMLNIQADAVNEEFENKLKDVKYPEDIYITHSSMFDKFNRKAFRPLTDKDGVNKLNIENMTMLMNDIDADMHSLNSQAVDISNKFANLYNGNQDFKTKIKNRVNDLISTISDAQILVDQYNKNSVVFKDSLTGYSFIDQGMTIGESCNIATSEGVAFLKIKSDNVVNNDNTTIMINSDTGEVFDPKKELIEMKDDPKAGNYHVAKIVSVKVGDAYENYVDYESTNDPHDNLYSIVDNEANTWFEYQKLGISEQDKKKYNITWADATKNGDNLTLDMIIRLHKTRSYEVNWLDITPFLPSKSKANVKVNKIKVSNDGAEWKEIYSGSDEIHSVSQTHLSKDVSGSKIISQGIYTFPMTQIKFIHIVFSQDIPYQETLSETIYYKSDIDPGSNVDNDEWLTSNTVMIKANELTQNIIDGPVGKYIIKDNTNNTKYIIKRNVIMDGFRYAIGLRGIDMYKREFEESSSIVTKKFITDKPIKKIALSASEFIPDKFSNLGIEMRNEWIKYYISIDDVNWHRISPSHHNPIGTTGLGYEEESFKIYEVNSLLSQEEKNLYINKGYIGSGKPIYGVRLKAVMKRPKEYRDLTPILEEYSLRLDLEEA